MVPGDYVTNMQVLGRILLKKNQVGADEVVPHARVITQKAPHVMLTLFHTIWGNRSEIKAQVSALHKSNQVLEARVLELERQLAVVIATRS